MRAAILGLLGICLFIFSCKKKVDTSVQDNAVNIEIQQTEAKIRHIWDFDYSVLNDFVPLVATDTIHGQAGEYFDFKSNNICYSYYANLYDTVLYKVISGTDMIYGGDTVVISSLSTTDFVFKTESITDTTHYENVVILSK